MPRYKDTTDRRAAIRPTEHIRIMKKRIDIVSVRDNPDYTRRAAEYAASCRSEVPHAVYEDYIAEVPYAAGPLPRWYLLTADDRPVGCAGLVPNDFISRCDLWPWVCALHVDEPYRGRGFVGMLLKRCIAEAEQAGCPSLYLATKLTGYYERYGFVYMCEGYGADGNALHIYRYDIRGAALLTGGGYTIRPERTGERGRLYELVKNAFATAKVSDGTEQDFADMLRGSDAFIPALALVAEYRGDPVAHLLLTRKYVRLKNGTHYEGVLAAPLSMDAARRGIGLGSVLLGEGMRRARALGFGAVFLCGDPAYYHRFGFRSVMRYGIVPEDDLPAECAMAAELYPGALAGIAGTIAYR